MHILNHVYTDLRLYMYLLMVHYMCVCFNDVML